jgi:hypothetical protein
MLFSLTDGPSIPRFQFPRSYLKKVTCSTVLHPTLFYTTS